MRKKKQALFSFMLFISSISFALAEGDICYNRNQYFLEDEITQKIKAKDSMLAACRKMGSIDSQKELDAMLKKYFDDLHKTNDRDRIKANQKFNDCLPSSSSKALVIAFEGTGAYEPIIPAALSRFNQCFAGKIDSTLTQKLNYTAHKIYKDRFGKNPNWSGLESGAMEELAGRADGANVDWYSFPSEELEQIGGKPIFEKDVLFQVANDVKNSIQRKPLGIQNALACIEKYQKAAAKMNIKPKIILMSHSSGGTALVKFSEHLKKQSHIQIDLAFSIDPVREAHEAFKEVVARKIATSLNPLDKNKNAPLVVSSQIQKEKLYKPSNIKRFCNFYQKSDTTGLDLGFGIQGSPVYQAQNEEITNLSSKGHGEITYDSRVLKSFHHQLDNLLYKKGSADCD
jgi:hypothetical protein